MADYDPTYGYQVSQMSASKAATFKYHTPDCVKYVMETRLTIRDLRLSYSCSQGILKMVTYELTAELTKIKARNDKLELTNLTVVNLKQRNEYLAKNLKISDKADEESKSRIIELETKLNAYENSINLAEEIIDYQIVGSKIAIGFDYSTKKKQVVDHELVKAKSKDAPPVYKNVNDPLFKKANFEPFNKDALFIKHEMLVGLGF